MISVQTSSPPDRTVLAEHLGTLATTAQAQGCEFDSGRRSTHTEVCRVGYTRRYSQGGGLGEVLPRGDAPARRTRPRPLAIRATCECPLSNFKPRESLPNVITRRSYSP